MICALCKQPIVKQFYYRNALGAVYHQSAQDCKPKERELSYPAKPQRRKESA